MSVVDGVLLVSPAPRWEHQRGVYARLGVAHYWIIDLDEPSVSVLELDGSAYHEHAVVRGDDLLQVDDPFTIAFRPTDLTKRHSYQT